jgi:cyclic-di-GMP-binding protein
MAQQNSFDIESIVDLQEVDNGINQALREIGTRFDFKGTHTSIQFDRKDKTVRLESADDYKLKSVKDVLLTRLAKRGISPKSILFDESEHALGGRAKQKGTIQQGISRDKAREIQDFMKKMKLKIQIQIQDDKLRVTSRSRDDLQNIINSLKEKDLGIPLTFTNYR